MGSSFANDRRSFTLIFDSFVASQGSGVLVTEQSKACSITITLHVPAGRSAGTLEATYRGYVSFPADTKGQQSATAFVQGGTRNRRAKTEYVGPIAKDYTAADSMKYSVEHDSPSTTTLTLTGEVRIDPFGSTNSAQITTDSIDGKLK